MARSQLVQFGFRSGIDEKTDPKQAQPGTLTSLVNMRQDKTGRLARRAGHTALSMTVAVGANITACKRLMTSKDELLLSDGNTLYGYSSKAAQWIAHDNVPRCLPRWTMVQQSAKDWNDPQYAFGNGYGVFVWTQSSSAGVAGEIYAMVRDVTSGTVVLPATRLSGGGGSSIMPRMIVCGTVGIAMWSDTSGKLIGCLIDLTAPYRGFGATNIIQSDQNTQLPFFDIRETTGNVLVGVYADTAATPKLKAFRCTVSLPNTITVTHTVNSLDTNGLYESPSIAYDPSTGWCWVAYRSATPFPTPTTEHCGVYAFSAVDCSVQALPVAVFSPPSGEVISTGIVVRSANDIHVVYSMVTNVSLYFSMSYDSVFHVINPVTQGAFPAMLLWSNLWSDGANAYVMLRMANTLYVCALVENGSSSYSAMRPIASIAPRIAYPVASISGSGAHPLGQSPHRVCNIIGSRWQTAGTVIADANSNARVCLTAIDLQLDDAWLMAGDTYPAQHCQPVEFGDLLHLSGGVPSSFDGQCVSEMGFLYGPDANSITLTAAGSGGGLGAGTYQYRVCYEWTDNRGQVYRSQPSVAKSVTTVANDKVTLTIPNLWLTTKQDKDLSTQLVQIIVYRTVVNGDGSLFYRQTPYAVPSTNLNDPSVQFSTIVDTTGDGSISGSTATLLYTNGGTLEAECPSSLACLIKHQRRLAGIGDDGRTVWLSNEYVDREAPRWNDEWQMQFDEPLTALASLDDKLIAFSERNIWFVTGEGPTDTGASNDWTAPQYIQTETGCIDPRSVFNTSEGVMFQGRRGYYLLDRALNVTFVGALIEDTVNANPLAIESLGRVSGETSCFAALMPSPGSSTGVRMHWDTFYRAWAEDQLVDGATTSRAVAGLANWDGTIVWATPAGQVYQQTSSAWTDGGTWYDSSFITGFIGASGPMGFQRVRRIQVNVDSHTNYDFKLSLAFDGSSAYAQSYQWPAAEVALQGGRALMHVGSQNGATPRCESIRIKCEILTPTNPGSYPITTGQAATLTGIGMDIVPKPGQKRLGSTVQV